MSLGPRVVVVHRTTEYDGLLAHHGTRGQADFFLRARGRDISEVEAQHDAVQAGLATVASAIPIDWRRGGVERRDLSRFLFSPEDIIVVVGQDGLVANVAKYLLSAQPVIGVNPDPDTNAGVLCQHAAASTAGLLRAVLGGGAREERRTMVRLAVDDGQELFALNEVYVGHRSHQTSRYTLEIDGSRERQASSGLIFGTGTGATGWCRSASLERGSRLALPDPDDGRLAWFVREAWPSPTTATTHTEGLLCAGHLSLEVESDGLVAFGDGLESDHLELSWGQRLRVEAAAQTLRLVTC